MSAGAYARPRYRRTRARRHLAVTRSGELRSRAAGVLLAALLTVGPMRPTATERALAGARSAGAW